MKRSFLHHKLALEGGQFVDGEAGASLVELILKSDVVEADPQKFFIVGKSFAKDSKKFNAPFEPP